MAQTLSQSIAGSTAESATQQRIVLVTGAGRRMECITALVLVCHGWDVAVYCHRSRMEVNVVATEIIAMGWRAAVLRANPPDEATAGHLITDCNVVLSTPTCLVSNTSLFQYDVATSFSYASLDTRMRTNVAVPLLLLYELHRALTADGAEHRGIVINLFDRKLDNLDLDFLPYMLSKAALLAVTMQLAQVLAPALRVVGVAPGIMMVLGDQSQDGFTCAHQMTPLDQSSTPEDIAEAVCYLATARAVIGTTLSVNRGQHLMPLARDVMPLIE